MLFWHVPAPNEALLISGSKRQKEAAQFRIVTGHGSFVVPVKQRARVLSLALREAEITEECITNQGIRLKVRAVAAFKVGDDSVSIANAARRFLSEQDNVLIENLPTLVEAAARGLAGASLTVLNGTQGVNEIVAGLVGQGISILDLLKKSTMAASAPSANGNAQAALDKIA